ncbi:MAG: hypothetical protein IPP91_09845 [Betaproteobacteria bacterium]|nr:hypothetical protein [Betaproteobacteria bacterium]
MKSFLRPTLRSVTAVFCALAATLAWSSSPAPVEHVGLDAERGDPARWYVPADTPKLKYETQVKEAQAVRGEALKECRVVQAGRADCVAQANAQYRSDMESARGLLAIRQGG